MSRSRVGKLPVIIPRGRTRPESALIAAEFATECNITIRNHVHVHTHWNEYKEDTGLLGDFVGKVAVSTYCMPYPPIVKPLIFRVCYSYAYSFMSLGKV